jgi:hypothetical protein
MRRAVVTRDPFNMGKKKSEDLDVDGRIILKWIIGKRDGILKFDSSRSR